MPFNYNIRTVRRKNTAKEGLKCTEDEWQRFVTLGHKFVQDHPDIIKAGFLGNEGRKRRVLMWFREMTTAGFNDAATSEGLPASFNDVDIPEAWLASCATFLVTSASLSQRRREERQQVRHGVTEAGGNTQGTEITTTRHDLVPDTIPRHNRPTDPFDLPDQKIRQSRFDFSIRIVRCRAGGTAKDTGHLSMEKLLSSVSRPYGADLNPSGIDVDTFNKLLSEVQAVDFDPVRDEAVYVPLGSKEKLRLNTAANLAYMIKQLLLPGDEVIVDGIYVRRCPPSGMNIRDTVIERKVNDNCHQR